LFDFDKDFKIGDTQIKALCREFKKFDNLKELIPQNNLVT
jgi:hypothetical protein